MSIPYKPKDYTTVSPYLIVNGASGTIDFLQRVFGAIELRRFPDAAGKIMHAEVRIDDTVVMIADSAEAGRRFRLTCMCMSPTLTRPTNALWKPERHRCKRR
jgi:uncharacterized glyoxalase superfamily protein PhnB